MIYVKVLYPDDQFVMFSALRVNLNNATKSPPREGGDQRFVTFSLPPGEGSTESYDRCEVLSIYLMSEQGSTLHKICGMVRDQAAKEMVFVQPVGTNAGEPPADFAGIPESEQPQTVAP